MGKIFKESNDFCLFSTTFDVIKKKLFIKDFELPLGRFEIGTKPVFAISLGITFIRKKEEKIIHLSFKDNCNVNYPFTEGTIHLLNANNIFIRKADITSALNESKPRFHDLDLLS